MSAMHHLISDFCCTTYAWVEVAGVKMSCWLKQQLLGGTACLGLQQKWVLAVRSGCCEAQPIGVCRLFSDEGQKEIM